MKTRTFFSKCVLLFLLVSMVFPTSACAAVMGSVAPQPPPGDVWIAAQNTTVYWVNQAFNGANFTQILTNGQGGYFSLWTPTGANGVGFTLIREAGAQPTTAILDWFKATGGKGNLVNFKDVSGIVDAMKQQGWKVIAASEVPAALKSTWAVVWNSVSTGLTIAAGTLISIIIVPIMTTPNELLAPYKDATIMS
jgi:hypothetical protein